MCSLEILPLTLFGSWFSFFLLTLFTSLLKDGCWWIILKKKWEKKNCNFQWLYINTEIELLRVFQTRLSHVFIKHTHRSNTYLIQNVYNILFFTSYNSKVKCIGLFLLLYQHLAMSLDTQLVYSLCIVQNRIWYWQQNNDIWCANPTTIWIYASKKKRCTWLSFLLSLQQNCNNNNQ